MLWKVLVYVALFGVSMGNVTREKTKRTTQLVSRTTVVTTELPMSTEFVTETDFNISSTFNTTTVPISTSNGTLTSTTTKKPIVSRHHQENLNCLCDLHRRSCDVGCCCDQDCSYENKKIFQSCDSVSRMNVDRTACRYSEIDYANFTVHEWEIQNNDFFCVAKTNLPPSFTVQKEKPFDNFEESRIEKNNGNFWPEAYDEKDQKVNFSEPYVQGVPIKLILNNSTLGIFKLSESFFTSGCNIQSDISFLDNFDSQCVHVLQENNKYLSADFYMKHFFVAKPEAINFTLLENKLLTCGAPFCSKPRTMICNDANLQNCRNATVKNIQLHCKQNGEHVNCYNIVDHLKFTIHHNGISGIKNITLFLHLVNITSKQGNQHHEILQKISVDHQWSSSVLNYSNILSGNPGYLVGKPILVGSLVNGTIKRHPETYPDNFMVLPYEDMGVCHIGKDLYQPIEFGFNTMLLCKIRGLVAVRNGSKAADICRKMQKDIFRYWNIEETNGSFVNRSYGLFGNAMNSILDDWRELMFEKEPKDVIGNITGNFSNKNTTLTCYGLIFGLAIDIFHAKVDLRKLVGQEKILGVSNQFHSSSNRSSIFIVKNGIISYEFDLDTRVVFWDKTSQKSRGLLDVPSLNIKLPSDFFYPFVKMGNNGVGVVPSFVLFSFFVFLSLM